MVFYNLFTMLSNEQAVQSVQALVIRLLEDEQLEVHPTLCYLILNKANGSGTMRMLFFPGEGDGSNYSEWFLAV